MSWCPVQNTEFSIPAGAIKYLSGHEETLQTLHLDFRGMGNDTAGDGLLLTWPVPSLRDFSKLQNVFLKSTLMYSTVNEVPGEQNNLVELLPPSIVSLRLADSMETLLLARLAKSLLRLAEAATEGRFPKLKRVTCDMEEFDDYLVRKMFASAGVRFGYDEKPFGNGDFRRRNRFQDILKRRGTFQY